MILLAARAEFEFGLWDCFGFDCTLTLRSTRQE